MHCSTHLKNNNNFLFKPLIKIIQVNIFFHCFILDLTVLKLSHQLSSLSSSSHLSLITVPLSLSLSFTLISISQLRSEAHRQRRLLNSDLKLIVNVASAGLNVAFAGLNVTDPSPDPRLRRSTPLLIRPTSFPPIRPTPTSSSPSRKPPSPPISLFSLL